LADSGFECDHDRVGRRWRL